MDPVARTQRLAKALRLLGPLVLLFAVVNGGVVDVLGPVTVLGLLLYVAIISSGAARAWFSAAAVALACDAIAAWVSWQHEGSTAGAVVIASSGAALLLAVLGCRHLATWFGGLRRWTTASVLAGGTALGLAIVAGYVAGRPIETDGPMRYFEGHVPVNALTIVVMVIALATYIATWRAFADLRVRVDAAADRATLDRATATYG
ncbi:MAG: hypothetical protein Q7V57_02860 [Actinomycetota bacterium]|nr:hypothetical protein [Actinomycetota bacterium]